MSLVKTLDFALFTQGTAAQRQQLGTDLAEGFVSAGFVKLINHGISEKTVDDAFRLVSVLSGVNATILIDKEIVQTIL
jgi:isopenicillin N synthase-like dioxygenase